MGITVRSHDNQMHVERCCQRHSVVFSNSAVERSRRQSSSPNGCPNCMVGAKLLRSASERQACGLGCRGILLLLAGHQLGSLAQPVGVAGLQLRPGGERQCKCPPSLQRRAGCISLCLALWLFNLPSSRWAFRGLTPSSRGRPASGPPLTSNVRRQNKCPGSRSQSYFGHFPVPQLA
jgi:hypothetical protein